MSGGLEGYAQAWYMNNSFGAIAYSSSTGRFGYSWRCGSFDEADRAALARCGPGGQIVVHGQNYHLALALGSGGSWGASLNVNPRKAKREALRNCGRHASNARIVLLLQTLHGVREEAPVQAPAAQAQRHDFAELAMQHHGWGAIAWSPSTGLYSYANDKSSAEYAAGRAIRNCKQPDAIAMIIGFNTYLALARCQGGFGAGEGKNSTEAEQAALNKCAAHGFSPRILLVIHTFEGIKKST